MGNQFYLLSSSCSDPFLGNKECVEVEIADDTDENGIQGGFDICGDD